jgi:hypothetical protein
VLQAFVRAPRLGRQRGGKTRNATRGAPGKRCCFTRAAHAPHAAVRLRPAPSSCAEARAGEARGARRRRPCGCAACAAHSARRTLCTRPCAHQAAQRRLRQARAAGGTPARLGAADLSTALQTERKTAAAGKCAPASCAPSRARCPHALGRARVGAAARGRQQQLALRVRRAVMTRQAAMRALLARGRTRTCAAPRGCVQQVLGARSARGCVPPAGPRSARAPAALPRAPSSQFPTSQLTRARSSRPPSGR